MKHIGQLYAKASNGKVKVWRCDVTDNGSMVTTHGYLDGNLTTDTKEVKGKNIGKSNETTPFQQACLEAESKMRKKMDEGYVTDQKDLKSQELTLPMLAHRFTERKHDITYPAFVQPKLNGVRCLADYDPSYMSRNGKEYTTLSHLDKEVMNILHEVGKSLILDGEIFHPDWNFQEITRAVKKQREVTTKLQYWVFDIADPTQTFEERYKKLKDAFYKHDDILGDISNLVLVPCIEVNNEDEMMENHINFTQGGFEGTIVRNKSGLYVFKHRSKDLQKFKDFLDDEFEIVGGHEGTGNDAGTIIFECKTKNDKVFSVRPKGSREIRRDWLNEINKLKGKMLTVRYQNLSEDGIPVFPVGIEIRDYE